MSTTMAIRIHGVGGPDMLRWEEVPLSERDRGRCSCGMKSSG